MPSTGRTVSIDWSELSDAYGSATAVGTLLRSLEPSPEADVWDELWSRICHQGTVYSASFAALPELVEVAAQWPPRERLMPVTLAGRILASNDGGAAQLFSDAALTEHGEILTTLTHETVVSWDWDNDQFVYLLAALLAFAGQRFWSRELERLADGDLNFQCPHCNAELFVVIGRDGIFTSAGEWVNHSTSKRGAIFPATEPARGVQEKIFNVATTTRHDEVATWLLALFGSSECPECGGRTQIWEEYERQFGDAD
jgi:hypothetical protein